MIWWIPVFVFFSLIFWLVFRPIAISELKSCPNSVTRYEDTIACVKTMQEEDNKHLTREVRLAKLHDHGIQHGYPADNVWRQNLQDPLKDIVQALLDGIPNTQG